MADAADPRLPAAAAAAAAGGVAEFRPSFGLQVTIEKFHGAKDQNPESFLQTIASAKELYGWSDAQTLAYAGLNLKGRALDWYNIQPPMTWRSFKRALVERFGLTPDLMLAALTRRVQGESESVRDYADALRTLVQCSRDPHLPCTLQHFFVNGLRWDLQVFVKTRRPKTFEEAVAEGEYYEQHFCGTTDQARAPAWGEHSPGTLPSLPVEPAKASCGGAAEDPVEAIARKLEKLTKHLHAICAQLPSYRSAAK